MAAALVGGAYVVPDDTLKHRVARLGLVAAAVLTMYKPVKSFIDDIKLAYETLEKMVMKLPNFPRDLIMTSFGSSFSDNVLLRVTANATFAHALKLHTSKPHCCVHKKGSRGES